MQNKDTLDSVVNVLCVYANHLMSEIAMQRVERNPSNYLRVISSLNDQRQPLMPLQNSGNFLQPPPSLSPVQQVIINPVFILCGNSPFNYQGQLLTPLQNIINVQPPPPLLPLLGRNPAHHAEPRAIITDMGQSPKNVNVNERVTAKTPHTELEDHNYVLSSTMPKRPRLVDREPADDKPIDYCDFCTDFATSCRSSLSNYYSTFHPFKKEEKMEHVCHKASTPKKEF